MLVASPAIAQRNISPRNKLAWGENIGWLNLNDANHFVGIACPADFNHDGSIDFFDYLDFADAFSTGC